MAVSISIDPGRRLLPANRRLLGTNIQWRDSGDGISTNGVPNTTLYNLTKELPYGSSYLRYPGGDKADNFDWTAGQGALGSRGTSTDINGTTQTVYFGSQEALNLCVAMGGAAPLFQLDIHGGPARARAWLAAYPQIKDWEVGNEEYLTSGDPAFWISPQTTVQRANALIAAMLAQDPTVRLWMPIHYETVGPIPGVSWPGYNSIVLPDLDPRINRFALHMYLPHGTTPTTDSIAWYAGMACYRSWEKFIADQLAELKLYGHASPELLITEYGMMQQSVVNRPRSVFGAIVHSDMMRVMALEPHIVGAMKWSLIADGPWGVYTTGASKRPMFRVHQMWDRLLNGDMVASEVTGATPQANDQYARVFSYTDTPSISCVSALGGGTLRAIVANKLLAATAAITVTMPLASGRTLTGRPRVRCLQSAASTDVFDDADSESIYTYTDLSVTRVDARTISFTAPAASLLLVEMEIGMAARSIAVNYNDVGATPATDGGMVAITGYASGNPPTITAPNHGFSNSDVILLTGLGGLDSFINDKFYTIGGVATNTFQLTGQNSFGASGVGATTTARVTNVLTAPITGITAANPPVVTAAAHGFSNGDIVFISGVAGMTQVNNIAFTVANKATNTFELSGITGAGFSAYTSGGIASRNLQVKPSFIANTGVVTAASHPFVNGQKVRLQGSGITNIVYNGTPSVASADDLLYTVSLAQAGDFSIVTEFNADGWGTYTSGGFAFRVQDLSSLSKDVRVYYDTSKTKTVIQDALQKARELLARV